MKAGPQCSHIATWIEFPELKIPAKSRFYFLLLGLLLLNAHLFASAMQASSGRVATVQKLGPDLYAYISSNDSSANATFLVANNGILVVDTGLNEQEGRKLLDEIRKVSPLPVRWIVNTHYHPDHRGGNSAVGPDAVIISTSYTRERTLGPKRKPTETSGPLPVYETINSVNEPLVLNLSGHEVRILHPGPAHTLGDLVVYFPDQHAIATGDLFLTNSCPAMDDGDMENWIPALDHMLTLPINHVVPGHFEVATKEQLLRFRDYLSELRQQVARMKQDGLSLEQLQRHLDMKAFKDFRQWPQYEATFADNAAAYYKQLGSRPDAPRHPQPAK